MATLLMWLSAPMQAWGTQSNFSHRDTGREPSKSGVIGLLCAALGRPRTESIEDLATLRMGVRVDQPGTIRRDYHTAGVDGYYKVDGYVTTKNAILSERYYLADAKFLVGLEGDPALLERLQDALQHPAWFLFLGRKAFVPSERVWLPDGLWDAPLEDVLAGYIPPETHRSGNPLRNLRLVLEVSDGEKVRNDYPLSFESRRFIPRRVRDITIHNPAYPEET